MQPDNNTMFGLSNLWQLWWPCGLKDIHTNESLEAKGEQPKHIQGFRIKHLHESNSKVSELNPRNHKSRKKDNKKLTQREVNQISSYSHSSATTGSTWYSCWLNRIGGCTIMLVFSSDTENKQHAKQTSSSSYKRQHKLIVKKL